MSAAPLPELPALRSPRREWTALLSDTFAGLAGGQLLVALGIPMLLKADAAWLFLIAGALAGALAWTPRRRAWLVGIDAVLLVAWLAIAFTPLIESSVARWVRDDVVVPPAGAIVVLSSSVQPDSSLDAAGADRLLAGLALLRSGVGVRLVTTRVVVAHRGKRIGSEIDQRRIASLLPAPLPRLELGVVGSTRDEAVAAARVLRPLGIRDVVVVTTPLHTRRACAAFERAGFRVTCHAARDRRYAVRELRPGSDRVAAFRDYLYERAATVRYRMKGWI